MHIDRGVQSWTAGRKPPDLGDEFDAWSKVGDQKPGNDRSRHPEIDSPIGDPPDLGLRHSNRGPDPSASARAPVSYPEKPDKENETDNHAQLHFSPHCNRVDHRARRFAIADEGVNQHDCTDPVNTSIQPSK